LFTSPIGHYFVRLQPLPHHPLVFCINPSPGTITRSCIALSWYHVVLLFDFTLTICLGLLPPHSITAYVYCFHHSRDDTLSLFILQIAPRSRLIIPLSILIISRPLTQISLIEFLAYVSPLGELLQLNNKTVYVYLGNTGFTSSTNEHVFFGC